MTPMLPKFAIAMLLISMLLAACSKPQPPDKERPVEPQATQLRDAMQAPLQQARDAQSKAQAADEAKSKAIDAAGG